VIPKWLANTIVVLVSLVWAGNFVAAVIVPGYAPDPVLNFVFLAIVGSALALRQDGTGALMSRVIAAVRVGVGPAPPNTAAPTAAVDPPKEDQQ
jgi:hypothetical protein